MKTQSSHVAGGTSRHRGGAVWLAAALAALAIVMPGRAFSADIVVNSLADAAPLVADGGVCTLREAVENADTDSQLNADCAAGTGADAITFNTAPGTITLAAFLPVSDAAGLSIDGAGQIAISGNHAARVFVVSDGAFLALENLTVKDGFIAGGPGGGIDNHGNTTITNSTLSGNVTGLSGGGIWNSVGGTVTITNSTLSGNSASDNGGGIYNDDGTVTIANSTLSGNSAQSGGGIVNFGNATITNSTLSGNSADFGGGIRNSVFGTLAITNSTLSGNSASSDGGGIRSSGTVTITNSTLSGNSAGTGSGIFNNGPLTITNSIVANSPVGIDCYQDASGDFTANGNNLDTDGTCPGFGEVTPAVLNLGPLFFNGGPTRTHALLAGSFAIDTGVQAECDAAGIVTDQRGEARDGVCDIGAYEFVSPPPPPAQADLSVANSAAKTAKTGKNLTYVIQVTNHGPDGAQDVLVNDALATGTGFVSVSPADGCNWPPVGSTGTVSCSYPALDKDASITLTVVAKVTAKGSAQLNNTVTASAETSDPNPVNNAATATSKLGR